MNSLLGQRENNPRESELEMWGKVAGGMRGCPAWLRGLGAPLRAAQEHR